MLDSALDIHELNQLLDTKTGTLLRYDTAFKLRDFYGSVLVFRHSVFNEEPVISVAFLICDRKFQKVHERLFEQLLEQIPNVGRKNFKIVKYREVGLTNAIQKVFPRLMSSTVGTTSLVILTSTLV